MSYLYCFIGFDLYSCNYYFIFLISICRFIGLEVLRSFQNQIAAIQRDAVWWLHTVVPTISKLPPKEYIHWYILQCFSFS